jgi:hypothetical protein
VCIVVNWKNVFQKHCEGPKAIVFVCDHLDHSCNNEVKTLHIAYDRVAIDIGTEYMSHIPD